MPLRVGAYPLSKAQPAWTFPARPTARGRRRKAEQLIERYNTLARKAAELRAKRDAIPFWDFPERRLLEQPLREAEAAAIEARQAAVAAQAALG